MKPHGKLTTTLSRGAVLAWFFSSCSTEPLTSTQTNARTTAVSEADQSAQKPGTTGGTTGGTSGGTTTGGGTTGGSNSNTQQGQQFFLATVSTKFEQQCKGCHSLPQSPTDTKAPLTIFSYSKMYAMLKQGPAADNNDLMNKVRALDSHGGGDRCGSAGPDASPCLEITQWWEKEFGATGGNQGTGLKGKLENVSPTGEIQGYALDSSNQGSPVTVLIYFDREAGAGVPDMTLTANGPGAAGGYPGNHRFSGIVPTAFRDGKSHTAYAYIQTTGAPVLLTSAPAAYTAWTPTVAGQNYYTNTVRPVLQTRCANCHVIQYSIQYASLISPAPNMGGALTNNNMINFPAGMDNHPGGNLCGSKNGSPCNLIQQWWSLEFSGN